MRIGIIGTGSVGTALATGFAETGHDVVLGSRSPADATGPAGVSVDSQRAAAAHGEVVVLAVPGGAAPKSRPAWPTNWQARRWSTPRTSTPNRPRTGRSPSGSPTPPPRPASSRRSTLSAPTG
ncbi:NAD(P)-binding domain-containing protein [Haloarcula pelagica]|nr:NAD(P)-binding domain-containing protein [Halomicroarcula sp. YJ-61-S]